MTDSSVCTAFPKAVWWCSRCGQFATDSPRLVGPPTCGMHGRSDKPAMKRVDVVPRAEFERAQKLAAEILSERVRFLLALQRIAFVSKHASPEHTLAMEALDV